jgi:hypothetical protein
VLLINRYALRSRIRDIIFTALASPDQEDVNRIHDYRFDPADVP